MAIEMTYKGNTEDVYYDNQTLHYRQFIGTDLEREYINLANVLYTYFNDSYVDRDKYVKVISSILNRIYKNKKVFEVSDFTDDGFPYYGEKKINANLKRLNDTYFRLRLAAFTFLESVGIELVSQDKDLDEITKIKVGIAHKALDYFSFTDMNADVRIYRNFDSLTRFDLECQLMDVVSDYLTTDKIDALKLGLLSQNCYKEYNGDHGAEDPNKSGFSKGESSIINDMLEINKKKAKSLEI